MLMYGDVQHMCWTQYYKAGRNLPNGELIPVEECFLGHSSHYATTIGDTLNLKTKHISPQFHIIYNDWFTTMYSTGDVSVDVEQWKTAVHVTP